MRKGGVPQTAAILSHRGMNVRQQPGPVATGSPGHPAGRARHGRLRLLALAGMGLCMLIFGSNFAISRHGLLNGLNAHDMLALRFASAGLLLLPVFLRGGVLHGVRTCAGIGWTRGLILVVMSGFPMSFLMMQGLTLAPAAHGATIAPGTVTLIGIIGGVALFGTVLTRNLVIGVIAVLLGLGTLAYAGTVHAAPGVIWGDLCFLGVGLVWGGYPLMIQLWKIDGLKATAVVSVLSLAYLPFYALFYFRGFDVAPWWVILSNGLNQGLLNVIVGLWIWGWAAGVLGASVVGRFPPLIPVIGTFLAIPILGEIPGIIQIVGVALIVGGLALTTLRRGTKSQAG